MVAIKKTLLTVAFLFISGFLLAREVTYTFLLWKANFNAAQLNAISGAGYQTNDQPLKMTDIFMPPNTNYLVVNVTTTTDTNNTTIVNAINAGNIKVLRISEIISEYNGGTGAVETRVKTRNFMKLPPDIWRDWSMYVSSP